IIAINLDTSSDNSSSDSDNNTSDSASTSQISTSKEIDYDSPEYKGPPKSLLKQYGYLSDEYKDKGSKHFQLAFASYHLQLAFASKHLQQAFTTCICKLAFAG
ncbi:hypothetical protein Tco_0761365, partial [Tanacetum coccineum]